MAEDRWCECCGIGCRLGVDQAIEKIAASIDGNWCSFFRVVANVCVGGVACFEGDADEFAAAGDAGPVNELVGSVCRWILVLGVGAGHFSIGLCTIFCEVSATVFGEVCKRVGIPRRCLYGMMSTRELISYCRFGLCAER